MARTNQATGGGGGGGTVTGATNGLQLLGTDVGLGGLMTQNTTIGALGFSLSFGSPVAGDLFSSFSGGAGDLNNASVFSLGVDPFGIGGLGAKIIGGSPSGGFQYINMVSVGDLDGFFGYGQNAVLAFSFDTLGGGGSSVGLTPTSALITSSGTTSVIGGDINISSSSGDINISSSSGDINISQGANNTVLVTTPVVTDMNNRSVLVRQTSGNIQRISVADLFSAASIDNIYTANGTLTSSRIVDGDANSYSINFENMSSFRAYGQNMILQSTLNNIDMTGATNVNIIAGDDFAVTATDRANLTANSIELFASSDIFMNQPTLDNSAPDILALQTDGMGNYYVRRIDASSIVTGVNIYNTDGILTTNRILAGASNAYSLSFQDLAGFAVTANGTIALSTTLGPATIESGNGELLSLISGGNSLYNSSNLRHVFGNGITSATPASPLIEATRGAGADVQGGTLNVYGGEGTGTQGGELIIGASIRGLSSSSTGNGRDEGLRFTEQGVARFGYPVSFGKFDKTAAQTLDTVFGAKEVFEGNIFTIAGTTAIEFIEANTLQPTNYGTVIHLYFTDDGAQVTNESLNSPPAGSAKIYLNGGQARWGNGNRIFNSGDTLTLVYTVFDGTTGWHELSSAVSGDYNGVRAIDNASSPYSILPENRVLIVDASTATTNVDLPQVSTCKGLTFTIKKIDASNYVVVDTFSSETIDGMASYTLSTQYQAVTIVAGDSEWHVIGTA